MLTAQIFVKLSAQLRRGGVSKQSPAASIDENEESTPPNGNNISTPESMNGSPNSSTTSARNRKVNRQTSGYRTGFDILEVEEPEKESEEGFGGDKKRLRADDEEEEIASKARHGELIPQLGTEFWEVYCNKLRVFGTEERLCDLANEPQPVVKNGDGNGDGDGANGMAM